MSSYLEEMRSYAERFNAEAAATAAERIPILAAERAAKDKADAEHRAQEAAAEAAAQEEQRRAKLSVKYRDQYRKRMGVKMKKCKVCGVQLPPEMNAHRRYCSERCREIGETQREAGYRRKAHPLPKVKVCEYCGATFKPTHGLQVKCPDCRRRRNLYASAKRFAKEEE